MKSHIGPNGPDKCSAAKGKCPFGGDEVHFNTVVEARIAYEEKMKNKTLENSLKKAPVDPRVRELALLERDLTNVFNDLNSSYNYKKDHISGIRPKVRKSFQIDGKWRDFDFSLSTFYGDEDDKTKILDIDETTYYGWNYRGGKPPAKIQGSSILIFEDSDGKKTFSGAMKYDVEYQTKEFSTMAEALNGLQELWTAVEEGRIRYGADEYY